MASGRRLLRPVRIPVPPHPHDEPPTGHAVDGSSPYAAGRGRSRSCRCCSRRACRRASSCTTFAGRWACFGRDATRTRCRCISLSSLVGPAAPPGTARRRATVGRPRPLRGTSRLSATQPGTARRRATVGRPRPLRGTSRLSAAPRSGHEPGSGRPAAPSDQRAPRAKSEINCGVAVSKPTTSSIPGSFGSAIENPFETIPTTTRRASMPDAAR
jgi:hypothetical protein